jgi:hypothetical protein
MPCAKLSRGVDRRTGTDVCARGHSFCPVACCSQYTEANYRFALSVEPGNSDLQRVAAQAGELRKAGMPTVPSSIGKEMATNPFMRVNEPSIKVSELWCWGWKSCGGEWGQKRVAHCLCTPQAAVPGGQTMSPEEVLGPCAR